MVSSEAFEEIEWTLEKESLNYEFEIDDSVIGQIEL
jgi:hypothetical protein